MELYASLSMFSSLPATKKKKNKYGTGTNDTDAACLMDYYVQLV